MTQVAVTVNRSVPLIDAATKQTAYLYTMNNITPSIQVPYPLPLDPDIGQKGNHLETRRSTVKGRRFTAYPPSHDPTFSQHSRPNNLTTGASSLGTLRGMSTEAETPS
jgi:hypothetical protein